MAKKKTAKKSAAPVSDSAERIPRKEPYSSQRMSAIQERIREQSTRLSALIRAMDDAKLDAVIIDGHAMLLRGLNQIENFLDNAARAVREAKLAQID